MPKQLYLIDRGKMALGTFTPSRDFTTLELLEDGEAFGWSWLIALDEKRLREQGEADHDFGYELLKQLALIIGQRLRIARRQLI